MRINIEIDPDLMTEALRVSGLRTKKAAVESTRLFVKSGGTLYNRHRLAGVRPWQDS